MATTQIPMITIHDLATNEVTERPMTSEEFAQYQIDVANAQAEQAAIDAQKANEESAKSKLAALGLTPEEIAALRG